MQELVCTHQLRLLQVRIKLDKRVLYAEFDASLALTHQLADVGSEGGQVLHGVIEGARAWEYGRSRKMLNSQLCGT